MWVLLDNSKLRSDGVPGSTDTSSVAAVETGRQHDELMNYNNKQKPKALSSSWVNRTEMIGGQMWFY